MELAIAIHAPSRGGLRTSLQERGAAYVSSVVDRFIVAQSGMAMGSGVTGSFPQAAQCGGQVTAWQAEAY